MEEICYQVINKHNNPASNDFNDLCIFPSRFLATNYITYLKKECGENPDNFSVRRVRIDFDPKP